MERLYRDAAKVLKKLEGKHGSLKSLVFTSTGSSGASLKKKLFALTAQTLKYKTVIIRVIEETSLLEKEPKLGRHLCTVLVYDFLFGKGLQCGGPLKKLITQNKDTLKAALAKHKDIKCASNGQAVLPKYARVNLLKISVNDAIALLSTEGYTLVSREDFLEHFRSCTLARGSHSEMTHNVYCRDDLLDYLFMFCPSTSLVSTSLYASSQLILQDKASCLPAHLLSPVPGSSVLDACAAPGNKTTHLASLMKDKGTVYAFDKDKERFSTLTQLVGKSGAMCIKASHRDILSVNPSELPDVKYILVDPSCSGSGIVNRIEYNSQVPDKRRLKSLSSFQKRILKHALSFPNVDRVVYSTCSVHCQENEAVVEHVLSCVNGEFDLVNILPEWKRRGKPLFSKGSYCIRTSSDDLTNGFFVAMFERKRTPSDSVFLPIDEPPVVRTGLPVEAPQVVKTVKRKTSKTRRKRTKLTPVTK